MKKEMSVTDTSFPSIERFMYVFLLLKEQAPFNYLLDFELTYRDRH